MALEVVSSGFQDFEGTEEPLSYVEVKVSDKQHAGLLHVEVARGSLLSQSKVPPSHPSSTSRATCAALMMMHT